MNPRLKLTSAVMVAAFVIAVAPAAAQRRDDNRRQRGERATQAAPAPRRDAARQAVGGTRSSGAQAAPRGGESRQSPVPRVAPRASENRQPAVPQVTPRSPRQSSAPPATRGNEVRRYSGPQAVPRGGDGRAVQRAVPRSQAPAPRLDDRRGYAPPRGGSGSSYSRPYVRPHNFVPHRPYLFRRPYYSFRPHFDIGFGLWLGYAVPYPWTYFGTYRPRVYGYYPHGYYGMAGLQYYGGLSFDVEPPDADLWVDGEYVGSVGTFTPYGEPLTLMPGVHRIAIVREGFQTIEFEVTVEPGRVLPYRGRMVPW